MQVRDSTCRWVISSAVRHVMVLVTLALSSVRSMGVVEHCALYDSRLVISHMPVSVISSAVRYVMVFIEPV